MLAYDDDPTDRSVLYHRAIAVAEEDCNAKL
jgi:hypothetical protein